MNKNLLFLCLFLICLTGCGNEQPVFPVYPVKGTVKYTDGKPLTDGWIEFTSQAPETKGRNSNSKIDKDGNFEMESFGRGKALTPVRSPRLSANLHQNSILQQAELKLQVSKFLRNIRIMKPVA